MQRIRYICRQFGTAVMVILLTGMMPAPVVFADDAAPADPTTSTATTTTPDNGPTGPDAATYSYNAGTGLWENDYYTYNPSTKETVPKTPLDCTYNPDTSQWDTTMWQFNSTTGAYEDVPVSLPVCPANATLHGGPDTTAATAGTTPSTPAADQTTDPTIDPAVTPAPVNTQSQIAAPADATPVPTPAPATTNTDTTNNGTVSDATSAGLTNTIDSNANSGSSSVVNNDTVGSVGTGNASAAANIVNLLQSQASFAGSGLTTFTANIQGDVSGDLVIDPSVLGQSNTANPVNLANATLTNTANGSITNNINLAATSGDATARNNDNVGSVTTGGANAVADVINMINSVVAANQSFLGVINIYGNYTGDILMPVDSLNALLGTTDSGTNSNASTAVNNSDTVNVANNVALNALTGSATASNNDSVGSVNTGNAMTNLTILNLTGHQVIAANSLLVFVNVLGKWVGLIMDAPAGTTSAALGGGVTNNAVLAANTQLTNTGTYGITNNITANATTGNASAVNNDNVGSVSTGNATASANIANLFNSNFSLSNWFGILFINVFGNWHGNFGVKHAAPVIAPITSGLSGPASGVATTLSNVKVFAFVPKAAPSGGSGGNGTSGNNTMMLAPLMSTDGSGPSGSVTDTTGLEKTSAVLGAASVKPAKPQASLQSANTGFNPSTLLIALAAVGFGFVGIERVRSSLRSRQTTTSGK